MPSPADIAEAYASSSDSDQELVLNLAMFLNSYLSNHLRTVENEDGKVLLINAHMYIVKISQVDDREVFKVCLEYWSKLVADLYEELQALPVADLVGLNLGGGIGGLAGGGFGGMGMDGAAQLRKNRYYGDVLTNLRLVMVGKMVKPEEVSVLLAATV